MIKYIISGGQTGADQAGLEVARAFGIATGGWAPAGYMTKNGPDFKLKEVYNLKEHKGDYKARTYENAKVSTGTIRCAVDFWSPGEICTLNAIKKFNKPWFDIYLPNPASVEEFIIWLLRYRIEVLNVAGNTQDTKGFNISGMTYNYLYDALTNLKKRLS